MRTIQALRIGPPLFAGSPGGGTLSRTRTSVDAIGDERYTAKPKRSRLVKEWAKPHDIRGGLDATFDSPPLATPARVRVDDDVEPAGDRRVCVRAARARPKPRR